MQWALHETIFRLLDYVDSRGVKTDIHYLNIIHNAGVTKNNLRCTPSVILTFIEGLL